MVLNVREVLETTLFDSEVIVTVNYLSRHAGIPIQDARDELERFYSKNKDKAALYAVYLITGEMKKPRMEGSERTSAQESMKYRRVQLVRDSNLVKVKNKYEKVDTCEIFCLHTHPIKSLYSLYNVDHLDDDEFLETDPDRSWISCPAAELLRSEMLKDHAESAKRLEESTKKQSPQASRSSEPCCSKSTAQRSKDKSDISALLAKAAARPKVVTPEKKTMENSVSTTKSDEARNVHTNEESSSVGSKKRRGRPILIDDEESGENLVESREHKEYEKNKFIPLSQKDLFSDGMSSPEPEEKIEIEKVEDEERPPKKGSKKMKDKKSSSPPVKKARTSPVRSLSTSVTTERVEEIAETSKKPSRKEYVTETYVDEDGFMVTKQVQKDVEVEGMTEKAENNKEKAMPPQKPLTPVKSQNTRKATDKKLPKKPMQGQSKISSFFAKK